MQSPSTRRAWIEILKICVLISYNLVALHPEGVDRNRNAAGSPRRYFASPSTRRAWIEIKFGANQTEFTMSPSTRRAWIEIVIFIHFRHFGEVALHPEGVDRNHKVNLSGRKAKQVALHPEGVDRNADRLGKIDEIIDSRPPPGGRG